MIPLDTQTSTHEYAPALFIDVVKPARTTEPLPAIVWLHGGGWRLGDRTGRPDLTRHFAIHGYVMASIDYGSHLPPAIPGNFTTSAPLCGGCAFAFDSHNTQMLGLLTTGVFEKFFEYMNTPTDAHIHVEGSGKEFPVAGFARARAELDLEVVGPPPERGARG
ncbi:hypothetical protein ACRCUN_16140 [Mycobacterium sp. LTG2003]